MEISAKFRTVQNVIINSGNETLHCWIYTTEANTENRKSQGQSYTVCNSVISSLNKAPHS